MAVLNPRENVCTKLDHFPLCMEWSPSSGENTCHCKELCGW